MLDIDPVELVRGRGQADGLLDQYVNDRPYAASSFLAVALNRVFRTAMTGVSKQRSELAATRIPLEVRIEPLPLRDEDGLIDELFGPLGWTTKFERFAAPSGSSRYGRLTLSGTHRLADALSHLYVLIPVLDTEKHYWVGEDEVEKLLLKGEGWLASHPGSELIARRYLKSRRDLTRLALARLAPEASEDEALVSVEATIEAPIKLHDLRLDTVARCLVESGAKSVADLGCGEGKLLARMLGNRQFESLVGLDASSVYLRYAAERLKLARPGGPQEGRLRLLHGALTYRDERWHGVSGDAGAIWTRTGRGFFDNKAMTEAVLSRVRDAITSAQIWDELKSNWLLLDAELMPWSVKSAALIEQQYEPVAIASQAGLSAALAAADAASARGVDAVALQDRLRSRYSRVSNLADTWRPYCWPVDAVNDLRIAPFHLLASEGAVHFDKGHLWHVGMAERLALAGQPLQKTNYRRVALDDAAACADAVGWWEELTAKGGEGIVVKPETFIANGSKGLIQPAVKVRGRQYLRMIYGPEYDLPENLTRLKQRGLGGKRNLALREFALGHEALSRFVAGEPLRRVHECVFAVLALESEPIDPRL